MNPAFYIALAAVVIAAGSAAALVARDPHHPANRLAGLMIAGAGWWAIFDLVRALTPDPEVARLATRLSSPGWCFIGPLTVHMVACVHVPPLRTALKLLPASYAVGVLFVAGACFTPWLIGPMQRGSGGAWETQPQAGLLVLLAVTLAHVVPIAVVGLRTVSRSPSPSDRAQARWLAVGVALPLLLVPLTNIVLPTLGLPTLRLGTLAFACFGALVAVTTHRHGTSPLARGTSTRDIVDALPDGVALVFLNGTIGSASEGLSRLLGRPSGTLEGDPLKVHLEAQVIEPLREVHLQETHLIGANGSPIPVALSTRILRDRQGLEYALVVVVRDRREVIQLRSQVVTAGRLASMGQLAAGIAHEINNPMAFVRTNLTLLREHCARIAKGPAEAELEYIAAEADELLEESLEGVERACAIVRDVNAFSHAGGGERGPVELGGLLDAVLRVASPHLQGRVEVERVYRDVPDAAGASQELKQVFLNLVLNAAQATDGHGCIRVETDREPDSVLVRIHDDGCGIPAQSMEHIFDPFFTTKAVGEGTGMGLFISYQIVRNHGGEIWATSEPDRGTTVTVRLPEHRAAAGDPHPSC